MRISPLHVLLLYVVLLPLAGHSNEWVGARLSTPDTIYPHLSWIEDPSNQLSLHSIQSRTDRQSNTDGQTPTFGFQNSTFWFFLPVLNDTRQQQWIVQAGRPHMDSLTLLVLDEQGPLLERIEHGDTLPWSKRPWPSTSLAFPLTLEPNKPYLLVFKASSSSVIELPLSVFSETEFLLREAVYLGLMGLCVGAILAMLFFNFFLYTSIRDRSYLMYVGYLIGILFHVVSRQGFGIRWLWPEAPELNNIIQALSGSLGTIFILLFCQEFFKLRSIAPRVSSLLSSAVGLYLVTILYVLATNSVLAIRVMTAAGGLSLIPLLGIGFWQWRNGNRAAPRFLLSFVPFGLMIPIFMLKTYGLIEHHILLDHGFEISASLAAWLLSFALASRFTFLQAENERIQRSATSQLEQRVTERTYELNMALEARSQFLAVMSHEIRTPLNGILGTAEMLRDNLTDDEQYRLLRVIEQSGNNLLALINDILDFSSIESGKVPINYEIFNLVALAEEIIQSFEHRSVHNNLDFQLHIAPHSGTFCQGDALRIRQVLLNLVSNAAKFTESGSIIVSINRDLQDADYVLFEVIDTGIGIPESVLGKLFEMFQQGDSSTRRRYGGAGLGLAICRQLVELMNGEIGVQSKVGEGSRFWFRLPLPRRDSLSAAALADGSVTPLAITDPINPENGLRVLAVDDNRINLTVAQGILRKLGHSSEVCESGPEAIATLLNDQRPFDLILMDCEMPDMDGFETAREIIRLQQEGKLAPVPMLALTAHALPDKIAACQAAGMRGHLAKPINSERLAQAIDSICSQMPGAANTLNQSAASE